VSRNGNNAVFIRQQGTTFPLPGGMDSIGVHRRMRPRIDEFPLEEGLLAVVVTDGIVHAGRRRGNPNSEEKILETISKYEGERSQVLADELLYEAMLLDQNRPCDDMTVTVLQLRPHREGELIRRMGVSFPFR
jgi:serine phosphatase RsbU (regulator of sigma subunit)